MRINLIFRKAYPTAFSIERLFAQLADEFGTRGHVVDRWELPEYNNQLGAVRGNIEWARKKEDSCTTSERVIHHITGDVNSVIFGLRHPTVITIHDCNPLLRYPKWHPRYWFYRWCIFEWPARKAAAVTVISEKTREELLRLTSCKPDNLHVIPNFVDPAFSYQPADFNAAYPTILQVGVKPNKNLPRLAAALQHIPCRLEIIGQPTPDDMALLDELDIDYHWETGITDAEVRQRYVDCDLLAFVSTYEGFGLPILEAQMTGRPVVSSNISPHVEVAGAGGAELVDPEDVVAIRAGIQKVIQNAKERELLIANGRQNALAYHIDAIAQRYVDLYERLL